MSRNNNSKLCLNNEPTYSKSLNKIKQLIEQLNNNESIKQPYFSFNFLKYYTHDYLVVPPGYDAQLTDLIRTFEKNGYFNNTLLVFMSDHGSRLTQYGFYTEPGRQERSMPFLSIRLPKHLRPKIVAFFKEFVCNPVAFFINLKKMTQYCFVCDPLFFACNSPRKIYQLIKMNHYFY
jgi:hypothetical protein